MRKLIVLACLFASLFAATVPADTPLRLDPESAYQAHEVQAFKVMVNRRLGRQTPTALKRLARLLADIANSVPDSYLGYLRQVTVWVEDGHSPNDESGVCSPAFYSIMFNIGSEQVGLLPAKSGGVTVYAATALRGPQAKRLRSSGSGWLLHEFVHAIHDQLMGLDHPGIKEAYYRALNRRIYDNVRPRFPRSDGQWQTWDAPAYARTNEREYFAEVSATHLGHPSVAFPFTRDEWMQRDPAGYEFMKQVWRDEEYVVVNDMAAAVSVFRAGEAGQFTPLLNLGPGERRLIATWPNTKLGYRLSAGDPTRACGGPAEGEWHVRPKPLDQSDN